MPFVFTGGIDDVVSMVYVDAFPDVRYQNSKFSIIEHISDKYDIFGTNLLDDEDGVIVRLLIDQDWNRPARVSRNVFEQWIAGRGKKPKTWRVLVQCLRDTELISLAKKIENVFKCPSPEKPVPSDSDDSEQEKGKLDNIASPFYHLSTVYQQWIQGRY